MLRHAFKEWAVICEALGKGFQTLILRKGGILEIDAGFQVEHERFWLFPTYVHQQESGVVDAALPLLNRVQGGRRLAEKSLRLSHFAEVKDVYRIQELDRALALGGMHFWSDATVRQRFEYKRPGLFALVVRVFAAPAPIELPNTPYDGCRSWVELQTELPTERSWPVLSDVEFEARASAIRSALGATQGNS